MDPATNSIVRKFKGVLIAFSILGIGSVTTLAFPKHAHHLALVLAIFLMLYGSYGMLPYLRARKWSEINAKIENVDESWLNITVGKYTSIKHYFPLVVYSYNVEGTIYNTNKVSFELENTWVPEGDSKYWELWGDTISAYYDPVNPGESVLIRKINAKRRSHHLAIILAGMIIFCLWGWLVYEIQ